MTKTFAGIGSRETPQRALNVLYNVSKRLAELGFLLNSGGADGADLACERGVLAGGGHPNIFLPWKGFNKHTSDLYDVCEDAIKMAMYYHPQGNNMSMVVRKIMGRNCYQVLGKDLLTPVEFILCWTEGGKAVGGTGQALRIAMDRDIPVFNVYHSNAINKLANHLSILGIKGLKEGVAK